MLKPAWIGLVPRGEANPWTYYEKYAEIGYKGMDGDVSRLPGDLMENYKRFTDLGLTPLNVNVPAGLMPGAPTFAELADDKDGLLSALIEKAHKQNITRSTAMGSSMIKSFSAGYGNNGSYEEMMADIEGMNKLCEKLEKEGITFAYHNHYQEFTTIHYGVPAMEHFLLKTDPRIKFDLDVGWVTIGGLDPVEFMQRIEGRIAAVHLKDAWDLDLPKARGENGLTGFTHLGSGKVNIAGAMAEADRQGVEWVIYEQDTLRNLDYVQALTASYLFMKETGLIG